MARGKGFRVEGADQLRAQLARLPEEIRKAERDAIAESAAVVEADQKAAMRVDTGAARAGVETRMASDGLSAEIGVFDPKLYYVVFQEFGTSEVPADPWAQPAAETERTKLTGRIERAIKARLR